MTFAGSEIFALFYACAVIGAVIYLFRLLGRLVQAHERIATALERNQQDR